MPKVLSEEQMDAALADALVGDSLTKIAKKLDFSNDMEFFRYRQRHPIFSKELDAMREAACDHLEDRMLTVVEDSETAHDARVRLDALAKVLAFKKPQRYGNRIDMNVTTTVDIGSSLDRMQNALDATYKDVTPLLATQKPNDSNDLW